MEEVSVPVIASILPEECDIPSICRPKNGAGRSRKKFPLHSFDGSPKLNTRDIVIFLCKACKVHIILSYTVLRKKDRVSLNE